MAEVDLTIRITGLSDDQLAQFGDVPKRIEKLLTEASGVLDGAIAGELPENALSGLFETFGTLASDAGNVPGLEDLFTPVKELIGKLPSTDLAVASDVGASITGFLDHFGPLKDVLLKGKLEDRVKDALSNTLDLTKGLVRENDQIKQMFSVLEEFFGLFQSLVGWKASPPDPAEFVRFLSRVLVGVPPDALARASAALEAALAQFDVILPPGADLRAWRDLPARQLAIWQGINVRLEAGGEVDWPALAAELQAARRVQLEGIAVRDRLAAAVLGNLNRLDLRGAAEVAVALRGVSLTTSVSLQPVFDGLLRQLRSMLAALERWSPTDVDLDLLAETFADKVVGSLDDTPIGQLRVMIVGFQQRLLDAIESLPFREIAHEAELALREVADAINIINPEAVRAPLRAFMNGIKSKIDAVSADAVGDSLSALWDRAETAVKAVSDEVKKLSDMLNTATASIQNFIQSITPTIDQINQSVTQINVVLGEFDLKQPAGEVIKALNEIRDTVSKVDVSKLPEPAVAAIKAGAEMLRSIDISGTINGPLNETLATIDPTAALKSVTATLAPVVAKLRLIDPSSITAEMDKPVDELLKALAKLDPQQLKGLIDEALRPVKEAIKDVDFAGMLAPLTNLYQEIEAKVGAILDPELIFKPLEKLYQPVIDVIDALEPTRLLALIEPHAETIGASAGGHAAPPAAITSAGDALRSAIKPAADGVDDPLFGYRIGDMLIPLIDLHRMLMEVVDRLDDSVLAPAAAQLQQNFNARLRDLNPINITARVRGKLEAVRGEFDALSVMQRLGEPTRAYHVAVGKIAVARLSVSAGNEAASLQVVASLPDLNPQLLVPDLSQVSGLVAALRTAEGRVDLGQLRLSFGDVGVRFEGLLPDFLRVSDFGAGALKQALRALDPAPVRTELNRIFDDIGRRLVALQEPAIDLLEKLALVVEERVLPLTPGNIIGMMQQLHAALKQEVLAFSPATFKDEVKLIFDVVKAQLSLLDPTFIVEELTGLRDQVLKSLDDLVGSLLPDTAPFDELVARIAALKPSQMLAGVTAALEPLTKLTALLDPAVMFEPIIAAIAKIRADLPGVIVDLEAAFDEVLAAFPEGGASGVSVSVEASVG